jgi:hypothetical protein
VLTPSPSRATRPVAAIIRGPEHLIREAVSDEDHFAFVDLIERVITLLIATYRRTGNVSTNRRFLWRISDLWLVSAS